MDGVYNATLTNLTSLSCYTNSSSAEVAVYASNLLTDGPPSFSFLSTLSHQGNQPISDTLQIGALSGVFITFAVLLAAFSAILIVVIVFLARSRAKALNELKLLRERSGQKQNVAYEEIKLAPSDINTSENVAYGHISN